MRQLLTYAVCAGFLLLSGGVTRPQGVPPAAPPPPPAAMIGGLEEGLVEGPAGVFAFELQGFEGPVRGKKVVTGAPFSAVAVTETVHALADGNRITRKTEAAVYRDSQGRFRREVSLAGLGPLHASGEQRSLIAIHDSVAGTSYLLNPERKEATKVPFPGGMRGPANAKAMVGGQKEYLEYRMKTRMAEENWQKESLGTRMINGVNAEGTRHTRTIPAGEIGNEKPIVIVSEQWYSPELQVMVMSKRNDPMFGETTYTLTNIQRQEPDASLFAVPSDYAVKEGGPGPGMMRRKFRQAQVAPLPNN